MKAYSTDLRERIVAAVKHEKNTPEEVATRYAVSHATVHRHLQLERDLRDLQPATGTGRSRLIPPEAEAALRAQVEANNDATLEEHRQAWLETTGVTLSLTIDVEARVGLAIGSRITPGNRASGFRVDGSFSMIGSGCTRASDFKARWSSRRVERLEVA
jgi:transposase